MVVLQSNLELQSKEGLTDLNNTSFVPERALWSIVSFYVALFPLSHYYQKFTGVLIIKSAIHSCFKVNSNLGEKSP